MGKGCIERANKMFKGRLIKEMRLDNISSIEEANVRLEIFLSNFKRHFARAHSNVYSRFS